MPPDERDPVLFARRGPVRTSQTSQRHCRWSRLLPVNRVVVPSGVGTALMLERRQISPRWVRVLTPADLPAMICGRVLAFLRLVTKLSRVGPIIVRPIPASGTGSLKRRALLNDRASAGPSPPPPVFDRPGGDQRCSRID
jgi:hypothetical protein